MSDNLPNNQGAFNGILDYFVSAKITLISNQNTELVHQQVDTTIQGLDTCLTTCLASLEAIGCLIQTADVTSLSQENLQGIGFAIENIAKLSLETIEVKEALHAKFIGNAN